MGFLNSLLQQHREHLERQRNRPFLRAAMAACSVVALADGEVSFAQRVRVDQILETLDKLKVFDPHEGVNLFHEFTDGILEHPEHGHQMALEAIREVADHDAEDAKLLIRVCLAVSEAEGEMKLADQIEIVSLCSTLGIEPVACGLYTDNLPESLLPKDA